MIALLLLCCSLSVLAGQYSDTLSFTGDVEADFLVPGTGALRNGVVELLDGYGV
jgi:hypothetical protein